jgi:hypothetical protein
MESENNKHESKMTSIEEIKDIFSIFHDGTIEGWSGDKNKLILKISCQYLAERIDKSFDYFFVELVNVTKLDLEPWMRNENDQAILKTELEDVFKASLEICFADLVNDYVSITCNQDDRDLDYCGGNLLIGASTVEVYDQNRNKLSLEALGGVCKAYWDEFEKRTP